MQQPSDALYGYDIPAIIHAYSATWAIHSVLGRFMWTFNVWEKYKLYSILFISWKNRSLRSKCLFVKFQRMCDGYGCDYLKLTCEGRARLGDYLVFTVHVWKIWMFKGHWWRKWVWLFALHVRRPWMWLWCMCKECGWMWVKKQGCDHLQCMGEDVVMIIYSTVCVWRSGCDYLQCIGEECGRDYLQCMCEEHWCD